MSDIGAVDVERDIFMEVSDMESDDDLKFTAISNSHRIRDMSLSDLRRMCDLCIEPPGKEYPGSTFTFRGASKLVNLRDLAESALKFYNDTKLKNFRLVKVCKINNIACTYYGLTFRAQEDGSEESCLFRGVVYLVGRTKPLFCEIKVDDDKVTLLPLDDDHVSSERACGSEDIPPSICRNDLGDGSVADS